MTLVDNLSALSIFQQASLRPSTIPMFLMCGVIWAAVLHHRSVDMGASSLSSNDLFCLIHSLFNLFQAIGDSKDLTRIYAFCIYLWWWDLMAIEQDAMTASFQKSHRGIGQCQRFSDLKDVAGLHGLRDCCLVDQISQRGEAKTTLRLCCVSCMEEWGDEPGNAILNGPFCPNARSIQRASLTEDGPSSRLNESRWDCKLASEWASQDSNLGSGPAISLLFQVIAIGAIRI